MLTISLKCSATIDHTLHECLERRGIKITQEAMRTVVERGMEVPVKGIFIIFDRNNIDELLAFFDTFSDRGKDGLVDIIAGKKDENFYPLAHHTIYYFFAKGNTVFCRTEKEQYEVSRKLYELESSLASKGFIRIGKSLVVNIVFINEIIPWFGGRLLLKMKGRNEEIEVSRNYVGDFKQFLGI